MAALPAAPFINAHLPVRTKISTINNSSSSPSHFLCNLNCRTRSYFSFSSPPSSPNLFSHSKPNPLSRVGVSLRSSSSVKRRALGEGSQQSVDGTVYQGIYGPWTVDPTDVREVILYRSGLVTAAASFVVAASAAFLPEDTFLKDFIKQDADFFYALGSGGLGLSLLLIHIYVTPIKRALQTLWAIGVLGSLGTYLNLAQPGGESLTHYVINNPTAVWFVGPLFAALTGLVFKEGLCYGKLEAGILTFVIPTLLLGHLTGLMDDNAKLSVLGLWMILFVVFSARKFTQPIKDDIGDKSVFMFNSLPEEEKEALIVKLEEQVGQSSN